MRNENFLHASNEVLVAEHCHILAVRDLSLHESDIVEYNESSHNDLIPV